MSISNFIESLSVDLDVKLNSRRYTDRQTTDVATQVCFLVMYIVNNAQCTELFLTVLYMSLKCLEVKRCGSNNI